MKMKLIKKDRLDETQWQNINYVWLKVVANVELVLPSDDEEPCSAEGIGEDK